MNPETTDRLREAVKSGGGLKLVAAKSGIAERTLANWLAGKAEPKVEGLSIVASALGVSMD